MSAEKTKKPARDMKIFSELINEEIVKMLLAGKVGVLRTDTIYGIVCDAKNESAVERVFALKGRDGDKPPIVLINDQSQLFDEPSPIQQKIMADMWPDKVSLIVASPSAPNWIERGSGQVAYRLPDNDDLCTLLGQTGPLIAPSANPQGETPARTIGEAANYFGDQIDFYVDGGKTTNMEPSRLFRINDDGTSEQLR